MTDSPFRHRNIQVLVDTTESAELDVLLQGIGAENFERMARALKALPQSSTDRSLGNFLIREIQGLDVIFLIGREGQDLIVTIGRIVPVDPKRPTEDLMKLVNITAIFRGAAGV